MRRDNLGCIPHLYVIADERLGRFTASATAQFPVDVTEVQAIGD
jgi:hypothetical protein